VALTRLEEEGKISALKNKWWKHKDVTEEKCVKIDKIEGMRLSMKQVGGLFIVLAVGYVLAVVLAICELALNRRRMLIMRGKVKENESSSIRHTPVQIGTLSEGGLERAVLRRRPQAKEALQTLAGQSVPGRGSGRSHRVGRSRQGAEEGEAASERRGRRRGRR